jgi:hypothetical protein
MKKLSKRFKEGKFLFEQIDRQHNIALYRKSLIGGKSYSFELITVKSHNGFKIGGVDMPSAEMYPGDKQWGGDLARTFTSQEEERAQKEFKALVKRVSK